VRERLRRRIHGGARLTTVDALVGLDGVHHVADVAEVRVAVVCTLLLRTTIPGILTALRNAGLEKHAIHLAVTGAV
jgi:hypothetical protein